MKNFKTLKCPNCASSRYIQLSEGLFECEYCKAKIQDDDSIKQTFLEDISSTKTKKQIHLVKAVVEEKQFLKKAFMYLSLSKRSPLDILSNSTFSPVKCNYVFYAIVDAEFSVISIKNHEHYNPYKNADRLSVDFQESVVYTHGHKLCIPLTNSNNEGQTKFVLDTNYTITNKKYSKPITVNQLQQKGLNLPKKEIVEQYIDQAISSHKIQMKAYAPLYRIVHKINKIDIFAIPEYSLEYTYENKKYKLTSFAYQINILGDIPLEKNFSKKKNKAEIVSSTITTFATSLSILFCLFNLIYRYNKLIVFDMAFALISVVSLIISLIISKHSKKKISKSVFSCQKNNLAEHLQKYSISLTDDDLNFIDSYVRWC